MNLFRSEEHLRRWPQLVAAPEDGMVSIEELLSVFSTDNRRHLLDEDYVTRWLPVRDRERRTALERIGKAIPLWLG